MVMQWSPLIVTMAVLLLVVSVACGGESKPTPSPTATFAPNPTPSPTATSAPSPTPSPTVTPAPVAVVVRERRRLTPEQEACLAEAIGERAAYELDAFGGCVIAAPVAVGEGKGLTQIMEPKPDFDLLPEASAPAGLGTVAWPNNFQESSALFGRLPSEIAGHKIKERLEESKRGVFSTTYEDDPEIGVAVLDLTKGDFFPPDTKTGQFVALNAQLPQWEVVAAGREGDLAWVQFKDDYIYGMIWGNAPSSIVFLAMANDLSVLMALVEAMVSAASG